MLLHVPEVLDANTARAMRAALDAADWEDGRRTTGAQGAAVKHNLQLPAGDLMLYPATSLHRVAPVARGARAGAFSGCRARSVTRASAACCSNWTRPSRSCARDGDRAHDCNKVLSLTALYRNLARCWARA